MNKKKLNETQENIKDVTTTNTETQENAAKNKKAAPEENPSKRPSVLAYRRHLSPTVGLLLSTTFEERADRNKWNIIPVQEKTIRCTKSHYNASDKDKKESNPQTIQFCHLAENQDTLVMEYCVSFDGNVEIPEMAGRKFIQKSSQIISALRNRYGIRELALRYAVNIANARALWKNRLKAKQIETVVTDAFDKTIEPLVFDSLKYKLNDFNYADDEKIALLADKIEAALLSSENFVKFHVVTYARMEMLETVHPSQEMVETKQKNLCSEPFANKLTAGFHYQKIGNALRTIDTWFKEYLITYFHPIPVEPFGSMTFERQAYRDGSNKDDFYTLFDKMMQTENLTAEEFYYIFACLIRGGAYGEKNEK